MKKTLKELDDLFMDCKIGKHKHFRAADRKSRLDTGLGVTVIVMSVAISVVLLIRMVEDEPSIIVKIIGVALAGICAIASGLQTFLKLDRTAASHRTVGNGYITIARRLSLLKAKLNDGTIDVDHFNTTLSHLYDEYDKINGTAEGLSTNQQDYELARNKVDKLSIDNSAATSDED